MSVVGIIVHPCWNPLSDLIEEVRRKDSERAMLSKDTNNHHGRHCTENKNKAYYGG